jgi:hypothetical protein
MPRPTKRKLASQQAIKKAKLALDAKRNQEREDLPLPEPEPMPYPDDDRLVDLMGDISDDSDEDFDPGSKDEGFWSALSDSDTDGPETDDEDDDVEDDTNSDAGNESNDEYDNEELEREALGLQFMKRLKDGGTAFDKQRQEMCGNRRLYGNGKSTLQRKEREGRLLMADGKQESVLMAFA